MSARLISLAILSLCLFSSTRSKAQGWPSFGRVSDSLDYYNAEPLVDSCIMYLKHNLPSDDPVGRMDAVHFLDQWITGVPYIIISQREYLFKVSNENLELMTQHVAGKLYKLRMVSSLPSNSIESEWEGLNWMLDLYEEGGFERIQKMEDLLEMRNNNELYNWLKRKLPNNWQLENR